MCIYIHFCSPSAACLRGYRARTLLIWRTNRNRTFVVYFLHSIEISGADARFATFGFHLSILKSTKFSLRTIIFSRKMSKPTAPYGTWKSPISSKLATESSVRFQEIRLDQKPGVVAGVSLNPY